MNILTSKQNEAITSCDFRTVVNGMVEVVESNRSVIKFRDLLEERVFETIVAIMPGELSVKIAFGTEL
jgi:hypothetical protein